VRATLYATPLGPQTASRARVLENRRGGGRDPLSELSGTLRVPGFSRFIVLVVMHTQEEALANIFDRIEANLADAGRGGFDSRVPGWVITAWKDADDETRGRAARAQLERYRLECVRKSVPRDVEFMLEFM